MVNNLTSGVGEGVAAAQENAPPSASSSDIPFVVRPGVERIIAPIELAIKHVTEIVAALLVVVETSILLIGVVSRYFLHNPTVWSDELASILFLWLCMIGAVIALQRTEHMRLTTIVRWFTPRWQLRAAILSSVMVIVLTGSLLIPAIEYIFEQWYILTPALQMPDTFRVLAMPVGLGLMLLLSIFHLLRHAPLKEFLQVAAFVAVVGVVLWFLAPFWKSIGNYNLLVFFALLVPFCVIMAVPIAIAFATATMIYLTITVPHIPVSVIVSRMDEGMSSLILLAVPLFVFLGLLIDFTGLARAMINFLASLLGHVRGGLSYVLLGAMYLVSGISGAKIADMAAVAPALFPEMEKRGSQRGELIALLSASGAMSDTIPPSLFLITLGAVCGVSIAALFTGGLMPAAFLALCMAVVVFFKSRNENLDGVRRFTKKEVTRLFIIAAPALALPFIIRFAVIEGIATATEVSTLGIAYSIIIGALLYRDGDWKRFYPALIETASLAGAILLIIAAATAMGWALTQSGFSHKVASLVQGLPGGKTTFLLATIVAFAFLGSVLEGIPAIVLFGPLMFPMSRAFGIHDVHYSMILIVSMGLGLFAPPFGVGFYGACAVGKGSPDEAMKRIWIYLFALLLGLIVIAAVPWISIGFLK
ncbi:MAG: TRAP transporter large permease subunit [Rhodospirillaceae bacterium]|nr:TRAP transporter large permease subunit [Rhodospirillaceae bacterium]